MIRYHPTEWADAHPGEEVKYYSCDVPGCNKIADNRWPNIYVSHMSRVHGIDSPAMKRTTEAWYLESKNMDVLQMHVLQEATELNNLNGKIRDIEDCFSLDPPAGGYASCHGFDVRTHFDTSVYPSPHKKASWVAHLQQIRRARNAVGSLYTRPGVMDTRDGVFDDLRSLLDPADDSGLDELTVSPGAADHGSDNPGPDNPGPDNPGRDGPERLSILTLTPKEAFAPLRQESAQLWWAHITGKQI